jgi:hypothetical protein
MNSLRNEINQIENDLERSYVIQRSQVKTDKEGWENAGFSKTTFYNWDAERRDYLNGLARRLNTEVNISIIMKIQELGMKAVEVKGKGLDSRNENIRQRVSTEILEWLIGKPTVRIDQKTDNTGEITVTIKRHDD